MTKRFRILFASMALSLSTGVLAGEPDLSDDAVRERIKPVGELLLEGDEMVVAAAEPAGPRSGADIYQASCFACHGTGALDAPKLGDAAAWQPRIAKGFDTIWQNAINGINAMPPMGTCGNCSDDDIKAAIEHMIDGI